MNKCEKEKERQYGHRKGLINLYNLGSNTILFIVSVINNLPEVGGTRLGNI